MYLYVCRREFVLKMSLNLYIFGVLKFFAGARRENMMSSVVHKMWILCHVVYCVV